MIKSAAKSETLWIAGAFMVAGAIEMNLPFLKDIIGEQYYGIAVMVTGMIVAYLRFRTTKPVSEL